MSSQNTEGQPRWWRRNRDVAVAAARESREVAAEAMFDLDLLQRDLPALMSAHRDAVTSRQHRGRATGVDPVVQDWETLSKRVDPVVEAFLELDASFNRDKDYEEPEADKFRDQFEAATQQMRAALPDMQRFRDRHDDVLLAAHNTTLAAPRVVEEAATAVEQAGRALQQAQAQGLSDPALLGTLHEAVTRVKSARAALTRREWTNVTKEASSAVSAAKDIHTRADALPQQALDVRNGFLSVRTRRDALQTQHDRLPPIMSELRRRYTLGSWKHIDDAPQRIDVAIGTVTEGLSALERTLDTKPLDVPAAVTLLRQVRAAASDVESILRAAKDTLSRLDEVSKDPETLLVAVRHKTVDARRFLSGLPAEKAQRYAYTFDNLSARTERLVTTTQAAHPDWGAVIAEATSIEQGLDAMIRTARSD